MTTPSIRMDLVAFAGVAEQATWAWFDENGQPKAEATGDATALLQAASSYALNGGFACEVTGRAYPQTTPTPLLCTYGSLLLPPVVSGSILFRNVIWLQRPSDLGPGLVFDSNEDFHFKFFGGQYLYRGNSAAMRVQPRNPTNPDSATACLMLDIDMRGVTAQQGLNPITIEFDPSLGSIKDCEFKFGEVNNQVFAPQTVRVLDPSATTVFARNKLSFGEVIGQAGASIQCGMAPNNPQNIYGNIWTFGGIQPLSATGDGFNTFGCDETVISGEIGGPGPNTCARGLVLEPTSSNIHYRVGRFTGCASAVVNAGTNNAAF